MANNTVNVTLTLTKYLGQRFFLEINKKIKVQGALFKETKSSPQYDPEKNDTIND